ncbi:hypothetical protein MTO96_038850 [Rhipicephalus appendiculatus]
MGVQRRQPSKQQKCRYGRKCFRRDVQHFKQFRHPKVSYCEPSLRDEDENRHEDESKDRADGRTITAELQENVIDIEVNGKWDHYDKPYCKARIDLPGTTFGLAAYDVNYDNGASGEIFCEKSTTKIGNFMRVDIMRKMRDRFRGQHFMDVDACIKAVAP